MRLDWLGSWGVGRVMTWVNLREHFIARHPEQGWILLFLTLAVALWYLVGAGEWLYKRYGSTIRTIRNFPLDSTRNSR